ncbi:MAG: HD domain-containing protein, partial [Alphaproteobacteria bacterium]
MTVLDVKPLTDRIRAYNPAIDDEMLSRAFSFAEKAHHGQVRASGEPYFTHPVEVALILVDMHLDPATIITALLHDVVEDTGVTLDAIRQKFTDEIASLVDGVTKLTRIEMKSDNKQAENFRKLVLAMSEDIRVLLVKLADRTHNMRTIDHISRADKRLRIAEETLAIFAPLAERIGMTHF